MTRDTALIAASETPSRRIDRLLHVAGLDFHILVTLLFRGWSILAGGATALLIPYCLSPSQQGYYYTFTAVLATQVFFELGLNQVLTQLASHAAAHLHGVADRPDGKARWQASIVSLLKLAARWNARMASLFFVALAIGGSLFFLHKGSLPISQWMATWIMLGAAAAFNLAMSARLAICEGLGEVGQVAQLRLRQSVVGYALLWALLLSGAGLWAAAAIPLASALGTFWWLTRNSVLKELHAGSAAHDAAAEGRYSWRRDIFPLQWKIALSWASGYFIFSFLTPVVFAHQGAEAAGRLGLALTIFSSISIVGMSWISAKVPVLAAHIARGQRRELNELFDRQAVRSIAATALCALLFLAALLGLIHAHSRIATRLPAMEAMGLLALVTVTNTAVFAMAAYMRAHKEEPLLVQSIVCATLIGVGVYGAAKISLIATVATYACISVLLGLPWCYLTFRKYHKRAQ